MTNLNQQIINMTNEHYKQYSKNTAQSQEQEVIMINNHNVLLKERKQLNIMLNQFQTLDTAYEDGNIMVNAGYMNYVIFLFIIIFLILLLFRFTFSSSQYGGSNSKTLNIYNIFS